MRICIISKYIPPASTDGIPRNRWDYAKQFTALGHEVHIITSGRDRFEQIIEGIYIHQIPSWDADIHKNSFSHLQVPEVVRGLLSYSYMVYKRVRELHDLYPIHLIESPLWDIEGYITRLKMPEIPFVLRLETTAMLLKEILSGKTPKKEPLNEIETHFLEIAGSYVFDSWSILRETERLYGIDFNDRPYAIIHHGIELKGASPVASQMCLPPGQKFKVLSVGRLEKRKGTDLLVTKILPKLLANNLDIEIHLAGKDSGEWDGFKEETGLSYHEYIQTHFKQHINKQVYLYGYVSDEKLDELYTAADTVLALSKYESFGLLYLEAMRKAKPLVVFNTGAVPEIFEDGKDAIIIPFDQPLKAVDALLQLKQDSKFRSKLARNAVKKLIDRFSSLRMAKECAAFYNELVFMPSKQRTFQIMNCLTDRDGVSNTTIDYGKLLKNEGISTQILSTHTTPAVKHLTKTIESVQFLESDLVIYHYWNFCDKAEYFNKLLTPKKVFFFHNLTTPNFFKSDDAAFHTTSKGFKQLTGLDNFDVYVGHTPYSLEILRHSLKKPIVTHIIPPWIDKDEILKRPFQASLVESLRKAHIFHIIFVGSIAPHKKQIDLVKFLEHYLKVNPNSHLSIIGGGAVNYVDEVKKLVKEKNLQKQVTITGKVTNEELYSYYRSADIYLSMCEHEGFGVPLAEAMVFDIPVVAYDCTAVGETVGENGCLFSEKDFGQVTAIIEKLRTNQEWEASVLCKQQKQLEKYNKDGILKAFRELQLLVNEHHYQRLTKIKSQPGFMLEEYFHFNDKRLIINGKYRYIDNEFLYAEETSGGIILEDEFSELEISFLFHEWSGKVSIQIDGAEAEVFDLFSAQRAIKSIKPKTPITFGLHRVTIKSTGEKNPFSLGNEIFLYNIKIRKPYNIQKNIAQNPSKLEVSIINADEELMAKTVKNKPAEKRPDNYVIFDKEYTHNSPDMIYSGNWEQRENNLMLTRDLSGTSFITTDLFFSELELFFIKHDWSGIVKVTVDDAYVEYFDLYGTKNIINSVRLNKIFPQTNHKVTITHSGKKNPISNSHEILFRGIRCYWGETIEISQEELKKKYKVSIVINTLDRATHLKTLLEALQGQTYPYFEVVVVNGPSKDDTQKIVDKYYGRIKYIRCPEANLSWSRNLGIDNSAGDYIAFIDDDAIPGDPYWIANFINYIIWNKTVGIGIVGGPVKHRDTEDYEFKNGATSDYAAQIFRDDDMKNISLDGRRWVKGVRGANNIILKKALVDIGGFDQKFIYYLDETDVCFQISRKGYSILNHPSNFVRHYSATGEFRKSPLELKWDVIARSDTYFCLKTGNDHIIVRLFKTWRNLKNKHFYKEIKEAYEKNSINKEDYSRYMNLIKKGFKEGLRWGLFENKKINYLKLPKSNFLYFNDGSKPEDTGVTLIQNRPRKNKKQDN